MEQITLTGGARIGMLNATWPFAKLSVSKDKLVLNASMIGSYIFKPDDIISIEPYTQIPFLGQGIKINHKVSQYKSKVIFWTMNNPKELIRQIKLTGFLDNHSNSSHTMDSEFIVERQKQGGFPIKRPIAIGFFVVWNILFIIDISNFAAKGLGSMPLGKGSIIGLSFVFLACLLMLISDNFRKFILKEGRELNEISQALYFIMFITGSMLLFFLFLF